jgi:hypothetical protein
MSDECYRQAVYLRRAKTIHVHMEEALTKPIASGGFFIFMDAYSYRVVNSQCS